MEPQNNQQPVFASNTHKTLTIIIAAIVIVALAAFLINRRVAAPQVSDNTENAGEEAGAPGCEPGYLFSVTTGKPCPEAADSATASAIDSKKNNTTLKNSSSSSSYVAALKQYLGRSIQFANDCKVTPSEPTFAKDTRILVNNGGTTTMSIGVGERTVNLRPYHYFTYKLATAGAVEMTCNGTNVGTITVQ